MGSISGIALRESNGIVHTTSGNSYDISWFVNNLRLANEDPNHIREFLQDYDFTSGNHQDLRPEGNGLVVVDMVQKQILRYQNVTGIGYLDSVIITGEARSIIEENGGNPDLPENVRVVYQATGDGADHYACVRFREFLDVGRITKIYDLRNSDGGSIQVSGMEIEEIDALMRGRNIRCEIDLSPFTVTSYAPRTVQGARDLQAKLASLGFQLSESETSAWDTWIANLRHE